MKEEKINEERGIGSEENLKEPKLIFNKPLSPEEKKKLIEYFIEESLEEFLREWKKNHSGEGLFSEMEKKKKTPLPKWLMTFILGICKHYLWKYIEDGCPGLVEDKEMTKACISEKIDEFFSKRFKVVKTKKNANP